MYYLDAIFRVSQLEDVRFLATLYAEVPGQLTFRGIRIRRTTDPLSALLARVEREPALLTGGDEFKIECLLDGAVTVKAVALRVECVLPGRQTPPVQLAWAAFLDEVVQQGGTIKRSPPPLDCMQALYNALCLSRAVTHCIPLKDAFIVAGDAARLFAVGACGVRPVEIFFDKDDGFCLDAETPCLEHINEQFRAWRRTGYRGPLSTHYDLY